MFQVQCRIFNHTYNPTCVRTGNKVLRQRLKGPIVAAYYPPRSTTLRELNGLFPGLETYDDLEADRVDSIAITRARGKGPPKKKRTAEGKPEDLFFSLVSRANCWNREQEICQEEARCKGCIVMGYS